MLKTLVNKLLVIFVCHNHLKRYKLKDSQILKGFKINLKCSKF